MPFDPARVPTRHEIKVNSKDDLDTLIDYLDNYPNLPVGAKEAILSDLSSYMPKKVEDAAG